jgi:hypothetical protein
MPHETVAGVLHVYVAFDWGDSLDLPRARDLAATGSYQELTRRRRTPSSFAYRPAPLHIQLPAQSFDLAEIGRVEATVGLTLFDIAAVSLSFRIPFTLDAGSLLRLAGSLADTGWLVEKARGMALPVFESLKSALEDPHFAPELSEEYFVFQLPPDALPLANDANWIAGLVHLDASPLSMEERDEALRLRISYSPEDLCIPDWTACALFDRDCDETLQAIEFANLQLLEFRHIDLRLDVSLSEASKAIHPLTRRILPFWRIQSRPLRVLGEMKVEANDLFERTGNVLKLVGDPYLARLYRLVSNRFHLDQWAENIQRKLEVAEGVYQVMSDQASAFRMEFMELVVVLLIAIEIALAFFHR